jgi:signal transduction histidine kinase
MMWERAGGGAADLAPGLDRLIRLALSRFADLILVDVLGADDTLRCIYAAHALPEKDSILRAEIGESPRSGGPRDRVARDGAPHLQRRIGEEDVRSIARDEAHLLRVRRLQLKSAVSVPVFTSDGQRGALTFGITEGERRFEEDDLSFALELARHVEWMVTHGWMSAEQQRLRALAERAADRMTRLQTITAALSRAPGPSQVAEVILGHGAEALGAVAGVLAQLDGAGTALEVVRAFGQPSLPDGKSIAIHLALPLTEAARSETPVVLTERREIEERFPLFAKMATAHGGGLVAAPLLVEGRVLGSFQLCFGEGRHPRDLDRDFLVAIADLAAQAFDRARAAREHAARIQSEQVFHERLLGIVGHDLRTPLAAIRLWGETLKRSPSLTARDSTAVERIFRSVDRMSHMIAQLLDLARARQAGGIPIEPRACDLGAVCRGILEESAAGHPGRLYFEAEGDLAGHWDRARLEQAVANLTGNALEHGDGGKVLLRAIGEPESVRLEVQNGGAPIEPAALPYVFDPYRRGRLDAGAPAGNLGLGLYIVQQIVLAHGGTIAVRSTAEEGTTFTIRLPRALRRKTAETSGG